MSDLPSCTLDSGTCYCTRRDGCMAADEDDLVTAEDCDCDERGRDCDHPDDTEWCSIPGCVRPVTFHPDGMHLTEDGREFGTPEPTLRVVT